MKWAVLLALVLLAWVLWKGGFLTPGRRGGEVVFQRAPAPPPPPRDDGGLPPAVAVDLFGGLLGRPGGGSGAGDGAGGDGEGAPAASPPAAASAVEEGPPVPRGRVSGRVGGTLEEPLGGVRVEATVPPSWKQAGEVRTDAEGRFTLEGVPAGVVLVEVSGGGLRWRAETVEVPADGAVEVALGGPVTLEGRSAWPDGSPASFVAAVPMESLADPLAVFRRLVELRVAGIRLVTPSADGAYLFEGLPPGPWLVGNELSFEVVRLEEGADGPVHLDLLPRFVAGRILPEAPLDPARVSVVAIPGSAGGLEKALAGSPRRLLDVLLAAWRGRPFDLPPTGQFRLAVPGEGGYRLFAAAEGNAAEGPAAAEAQDGSLPGTAVLLLRPAAKVVVTVPDPGEEEVLLVAVRDDRGAVVALAAAPPPAVLFLPAGPWRVEVLRSGGRRAGTEVLVPASGEVAVTVGGE